MASKTYRLLSSWGPVAAWCALIFAFSSVPDLKSGLDFDYPLRKAAHMAEYAVLYLLTLRARSGRRAWAAAAFSVFYAMSDEYHQSFVPGRSGLWSDVAVDAAGVLLAFFFRRHPVQPG